MQRSGKKSVVLFTDIVKSSTWWKERPDEFAKALKQHGNQVARLVRKYHGFLIKTMGDSYMIEFKNLENAIDFGMEMQQELEFTKPIVIGPLATNKLRVRIGVSTGLVRVQHVTIQNGIRVKDLFGPTVNIASRMESKLCKPGGIAFSNGRPDRKSDHPEMRKVLEHLHKTWNAPEIERIDFENHCTRTDPIRRSTRLIASSMCQLTATLHGPGPLTAYSVQLKEP